MKKKWLSLAIVFSIATIGILFVPDLSVSAQANPWSDAGIEGETNIESSGFYDDLDNLVTLIMVVGGFWTIGCLIWAGMKLQGSSGNPQKRTEGIVALGFVALGGFVMIKAYDIASWISSFGA